MIQETELQTAMGVSAARLGLTRTDERDQRRRAASNSIRIRLASPDVIRSWSHGEVTKPETINYRSFKPERDGLFCEKIFGPVKDWECNCGKYKRIRYRGVICDRCGVEVTQAKVRRERLGHINLAVPVSHIWYFKAVPSRIGHLLDMSIRDLERVLYYESYVVIDPGTSGMKKKQLVSEDEYYELTQDETITMNAKMGAEAIRDLLTEIDLDELSAELRAIAKIENSVQRKKETLKRLRIVEAFRQSGNRPEWMILSVIPVLPPDLRPLVPLEGGRFATSDLNDLYRRVIIRNNRLKKLIDIRAPEVILRNEKRMLQEAVDALFDNGRRSRAVRGQGNRPLKSLSDMLKGKQGRFRQNLLGKRVDYSGRSVIVSGPNLKLHQCGLPKLMALELFKPFIMSRLVERKSVQNIKAAKKHVDSMIPEVWDVLEEVIAEHPVLLNRAPTLHRLGIQAFEPVLVEGKAIQVHPLVCHAFNADFDGDQMAVHLPLSAEAQAEARILMLSSNNILSPAHGRPIAIPTQDMVIGAYYLTEMVDGAPGEGRYFGSLSEAEMAFDRSSYDPEAAPLSIHAKIRVRMPASKFPEDRFVERSDAAPDSILVKRLESHNGDTPLVVVETTLGRLLFNEAFPSDFPFQDTVVKKRDMTTIVDDLVRFYPKAIVAQSLDHLKDLGFHFSTRSGLTISIDDVRTPPDKASILDGFEREAEKVETQFRKGVITDDERRQKQIEIWTEATDKVR